MEVGVVALDGAFPSPFTIGLQVVSNPKVSFVHVVAVKVKYSASLYSTISADCTVRLLELSTHVTVPNQAASSSDVMTARLEDFRLQELSAYSNLRPRLLPLDT